MGDSVLKCPLCCDKTFSSKSELIDHLANILGTLSCPICSNKWSSIGHLIEHLSLDNCYPDNTANTPFTIDTGSQNNSDTIQNSNSQLENILNPKLELEKGK